MQRILCGSAVCAVCGPGVWSARRQEITVACRAASELGLVAVLVTLTVPHDRRTRLVDELDMLLRGWKAIAGAGRSWRRMKERFGIAGHIRALEVEDAPNGWHAHYHAVFFLRGDAREEVVQEFVAGIAEVWLGTLGLTGARSAEVGKLVHGKALHRPESSIGGYLSKGPAATITDFAEAVLEGGQPARVARMRWRELQQELTGRTRVAFSRGVKMLVRKERSLRSWCQMTRPQQGAESQVPPTTAASSQPKPGPERIPRERGPSGWLGRVPRLVRGKLAQYRSWGRRT